MKTVQIGLLFSLTGTTSVTERGQYKAALYALKQFESQQKYRIKFQFLVRDIQSDPSETVKQATELAKSGVKIMVGCYTSACRKAILPILEQFDCLLVYPTLYEGNETHPNVFYTGEVPNQQIFTMLNYITHHYEPKIYLIGTDYIYPRNTNHQVHEFMENLKGEVVGEQYVPFGYSHFTPVLQNILRAESNVILSTLVGESITPFYQTYHKMGLDPQKLPIYSPITTEVEIKSMGAMFASGHYSCGSYFQSIDTPVNRRFVQEFRTLYGKDEVVSFVMVNTYIGVYLLLTSISTMKTTQPRKILDSLRGKEFQSPGGTIKVNSSNFHLSREVRIGRATANGQFTIVWDSGKSIPAKPFLNKSPDNAASVSESGDLKAIIETWGENTKDAILILSETNRVLYANTKATNWLGIHENDYMAPGQIEQMNGTCSIIQQVIGFKDAYRLILIREKKNNPISKRQPDRQFTYHFHLIKTKNPTYQKQLKIAEVAAQTDSNVLIYGETGCGKEILARSIHEQSHRRENPFIAINAGAMPRELVNSELFGYVHGAFTGAKKGGAIGKFEAANHGTLFLDEIGEMPLDLQVTLLRVIEEKKVTRIGDFVERDLDVRIIAATNRNLKEEIAYKGSFRSDLYYRLNVLSIYIPPLRERKEDLEHLAVEFLRQFHQHYNKGPLTLASDTLAMLMNYHWPGNIRELRNVLERSFLLAIDKKTLNFDYLPDELLYQQHPSPKTDSTLVELEKQMITRIIQETQNMSQAAKRLGIARSTLYRKVKQWKIDI